MTIGGAQSRNHDYCYDASRRLTAVRAGGCGGTILTHLSYDVQGNLASRGPQSYRFDFGNRLREVDGVERYRYDGHGRRVLAMNFASGTVLSQYGLDGRLLYQKSDRTGLQTDQIHLGGSLIAIRELPASGSGTAVVKYQHTDALGSPVVVTRQDRSIVEESEYEPYGQVLNRPMHDGPGYTGHVEDAATGLVYMQQRYYDPRIGRFLSVDPVAALDSGDMRQLNRYAYAYNSPFVFTDPDGRQNGRVNRNPDYSSLTLDQKHHLAYIIANKYGIDMEGVVVIVQPGDIWAAEAGADGMHIWEGAFATESRLAATIGHEKEVHYDIQIDGRGEGFGRTPEGEVEAYQYNIDNAERFKNTPEEIEHFKNARDGYQRQIDEKSR